MNQEQAPPIETRDRILDAARTLFARNGFEGTSVRDITGAADVNLGAVTYHFGGKTQLYEAVIASFIDPMRVRVAEAVAAPGPVLDRIEAGVRAVFTNFQAFPEQPSIMLHEMARQGPLPRPVQEWITEALRNLGGLIAEGQARGEIAPGDPQLLTLSVLSQPFFFAITRHPLSRTPDIPVHAVDPGAVADSACAFIRRGLEAPRRDS